MAAIHTRSLRSLAYNTHFAVSLLTVATPIFWPVEALRAKL